MHLQRITLSTHPWSQLRAQPERKAVPYCCKPLPDMKGSVVVRLPTDFALGAWFSWLELESPRNFAPRRYRPTSLSALRGSNRRVCNSSHESCRHCKAVQEQFTFDIHEEECKASPSWSSIAVTRPTVAGICAGSLLFFQSTVGLSSQITAVVVDLEGPFHVTDGSGSARI